jgi:LPXTG-motif cell wall-anchored protein
MIGATGMVTLTERGRSTRLPSGGEGHGHHDMATSPATDQEIRRPGAGRRWHLAVAVGLLAATGAAAGLASTANAQDSEGGGYVTTTTASGQSLDVSGFSPDCIRDVPIINYTIAAVGFAPVENSATLVFRAIDGTFIETREVESLSGQTVWPGAAVDNAGNATDWPGWKRAADGVSWIPDPSDAFLRDGLRIEVTVDSITATATVSYVPDSAPCANPPRPQTPLPSTGGGPGNSVIIGAAVLLAGLLLVTITRRRRGGVASPTT